MTSRHLAARLLRNLDPRFSLELGNEVGFSQLLRCSSAEPSAVSPNNGGAGGGANLRVS